MKVEKIHKGQAKRIIEKIKKRTANQNEYKGLQSLKRFIKRRNMGIKEFWKHERARLLNNQKPTRNWDNHQIQDIINGKRPKYKGKTIQGHHTYNVVKYPHLANKGELIYPATFKEHLYYWHGGNFAHSLSGKPMVDIKFDF